jgi:hypothetical protein
MFLSSCQVKQFNYTTGVIPRGTSIRLGIAALQFSGGLRYLGDAPQNKCSLPVSD